jgi:tRNA A37 threonylcarbamoyladenosine synthetase subunit TsaC/SUA5/YrdC
MLKALLPGPFTFILPTSENVPKFVIGQRHPGHKTRKWKRKEIGVRIPNDEVSLLIMQDMDVPLLTGSVPESGEDYVDIALRSLSATDQADIGDDGDADDFADMNDLPDMDDDINDYESDFNDTDYFQALHDFPWAKMVDFIVVNGPRGGGKAELLSTIVDLTVSDNPVVIRQGKGVLGEFLKKF